MAIHGLWSLACLEAERFLLLSDIARTQNVSESYLSKVFQKLTHAGLIQAVRGKNGGYALARPPATITVGDVVRAIEADPPMYHCLAEERCCEAVENCLLLHVFGEAERQMYAVLDGVTLADLLAASTRGSGRLSWLPPQVMLHTLTPLPPPAPSV
jgi:Rrf2 family nitric oxide-sensitive transcriptional repressor